MAAKSKKKSTRVTRYSCGHGDVAKFSPAAFNRDVNILNILLETNAAMRVYFALGEAIRRVGLLDQRTESARVNLRLSAKSLVVHGSDDHAGREEEGQCLTGVLRGLPG